MPMTHDEWMTEMLRLETAREGISGEALIANFKEALEVAKQVPEYRGSKGPAEAIKNAARAGERYLAGRAPLTFMPGLKKALDK